MAWGPVSAPTRGFLSLLGIKNQGRNPGQLLDDVRGVVEMRDWYLQGRALQARFVTVRTSPAVGFFYAPVQVPETETWYVHALTVGAQVGFGPAVVVDVVGLAPAARFLFPQTLMVGESITWRDSPVAINATPQVAPPSMRDFWLPPGSQAGVFANRADIQNGAGTDLQLELDIRYTPMVV